MDTAHIKQRDGESADEFIARLLKLIADESDKRSYYAKETSRLLDVVERGIRLRGEMVTAAVLAEREACARVATHPTSFNANGSAILAARDIASAIRSRSA